MQLFYNLRYELKSKFQSFKLNLGLLIVYNPTSGLIRPFAR